jgi:hypothetical protein
MTAKQLACTFIVEAQPLKRAVSWAVMSGCPVPRIPVNIDTWIGDADSVSNATGPDSIVRSGCDAVVTLSPRLSVRSAQLHLATRGGCFASASCRGALGALHPPSPHIVQFERLRDVARATLVDAASREQRLVVRDPSRPSRRRPASRRAADTSARGRCSDRAGATLPHRRRAVARCQGADGAGASRRISSKTQSGWSKGSATRRSGIGESAGGTG